MLKKFISKSLDAQGYGTAFYSRQGGVSSGDYDSLNSCVNSLDDITKVEENLRRIASDIGCEFGNLKLINQVHGNEAYIMEDALENTRPIKADAIVTKVKGVALGINTADCTPVLFCDPVAKIVGAAHAGWRSAVSGILQSTVEAMEKIGATRKNIRACIGPTIAQETYEVDQSFYENFLRQDSANKKYFYDSKKSNHHMFNLPGYCEDNLKSMNLAEVENLKLNTYTNEDLFFSCRRNFHQDRKAFGGQLSVIINK